MIKINVFIPFVLVFIGFAYVACSSANHPPPLPGCEPSTPCIGLPIVPIGKTIVDSGTGNDSSTKDASETGDVRVLQQDVAADVIDVDG